VRACHDLSEGGLAVSAAEMAFAGGLGVAMDLSAVPCTGDVSEAARLFGESAGRFLIEVQPDKYDDFLRIVKDCPLGEIGRVTDTGRVVISAEGRQAIDLPLAEAKAAWQRTFDW
jgi:phosphoribosylformylglycinamidine (FGAM) synthase-like enzyme